METIVQRLNSRRDLRLPRFYDVVILAITAILVGFSIVMVYSTTGIVSTEKYGDAFYFVKRQVFAAVIGLVLMFLMARMNVEKIKKLSPYFLPVTLVLLLCTLLPGLGESAGGAKRWIRLPFLRFQPAEFVKVIFIIFVAGFLARHENKLASFKQGVMKPFFIVCMVSGLLLLQPDFGSAVVIALIAFCMVASAGVRLRYMVLCGAVLLFCMTFLVVISPYRMKRIVSFLYPWADASGKGYQLIQSLIAVGTGQVSGVGLGSSQQKLFFLPAAHTDFIFSVIGEELGFIGCLAIMCLFLVFLWRGLLIASRLADDTFSSSLALGLTLLVALPALLNIGVVTGMLPTKGLVLPLVGYGGTSLVACLAAIGLLMALSRSVHQRS